MTTPIRETSLLDEVQKKESNPNGKAAPKKITPKSTSTIRTPKLQEKLEELYAGIGMGAMLVDPECAAVLIDHAPAMAASWVSLAETNPAVKRVLEKMVTASGWGGVVMAHSPVIMAVLSHHTNFGDRLAELVSGKVVNGAGRETDPNA